MWWLRPERADPRASTAGGRGQGELRCRRRRRLRDRGRRQELPGVLQGHDSGLRYRHQRPVDPYLQGQPALHRRGARQLGQRGLPGRGTLRRADPCRASEGERMMGGWLALAFGAGMLAPVNPCGFAVLPAFLAYAVGTDTATTGTTRAGMATRLAGGLRAGAALTLGFAGTFTLIGTLLAVGMRSLIGVVPWAA